MAFTFQRPEQLLHVVEIFGQAQVNEEEGRAGMAAQQALGLFPQLHQRQVVLATEAPVGRQLQLVVAFVLGL
jgi:hypothetical protein